MADDKKDPTPEDDAGNKPDPPPGEDRAAKAALEEERKSRRAAEKAAAELRTKLKELEDRDKSDGEKLADRVAAAEKRADEAEARALRAEVAFAKGLTPAQAKRLSGSTKEELEADADDLLASFGPGKKADDDAGDKAPPNTTSRPKEDLRGGGDPTNAPAVDLRKMVDEIPRR